MQTGQDLERIVGMLRTRYGWQRQRDRHCTTDNTEKLPPLHVRPLA